MFDGRTCCKNCPKRLACKRENCAKRHPTVLHTSGNDFPSNVKTISKEGKATCTPQTDGNSTVVFTNGEIETQNYMATADGKTVIARAIVPVKINVERRNEPVITYAFLDNGSDSTFCTEMLANS